MTIELVPDVPASSVNDKVYEPTGFAKEIFTSRYAIDPEESWESACNRVSTNVSFAEKDDLLKKKWKNKFYRELITNRFMPGGRIWHAAGRPKGQYMNCFVIPVTSDSREGWTKAISDTTIITGMGGGVGINFAPIRPKGESIRGTGGIASGPCGLMHIINAVGDVIRASGGRRPALMMCLDADHPNIIEFLDKKLDLQQLNNANVSIVIPPDKEEMFIKAVKSGGDWPLFWNNKQYGSINARDFWNRLVKNALKSAEPGILNGHRANLMNNIGYYKPLIATNPCLAGDMRLLTPNGYRTIRELWRDGDYQEFDGSPDIVKNGKLMIVNDSGTVPATNVYKTSDNAEIFRVRFSDGSHIDATANHQFIVIREDSKEVRCSLSELETNDVISVITGEGNFGIYYEPRYARLAGWVIGDGTVTEIKSAQRAYVTAWGDDIQSVGPVLREDLQYIYEKYNTSTTQSNNWADKEAQSQKHFTTPKLTLVSSVLGRLLMNDGVVPGNKHRVPNSIWDGDSATISGFLSGLFSADGSVQVSDKKKSISIRLGQTNRQLLEDCQLLLLQFGIHSTVLWRKAAGQHPMNDGRGGMKLYNRKEFYELIINGIYNVDSFIKKIGFMQDSKNNKAKEWLNLHLGSNNSLSAIKRHKLVVSIEPIGTQETFCLTEPETHKVVVNGSLIGQCSEQWLEAYGACDLGALVLPRFVQNGVFNWDQFGETIATAVRFLDDVIDVNLYPIQESQEAMHAVRRIGLGIMGLHHMLLLLGMNYDSDASLSFVERLFQFMRNRAYESSCFLATEKGSFPAFDADKYLQSGFIKTLTTGVREKIRLYGIRNCNLMTIAPTGTTSIVSDCSSGMEPIYAFSYERKYRSGEELKSELIYDPVFKYYMEEKLDPSIMQAAYDLKPRAHFEIQRICQKYTDNALSKTVNIAAKHDFDEISDLMLEYLPDIKGVTVYVDGSRGEAPLSGAANLEEAMASFCPKGVCGL